MAVQPTDHAGLQMLSLSDCLRLLAAVPLGRVGFQSDGEMLVVPVNHVVDGQDVVFLAAPGATLSAAEAHGRVVFEADSYDQANRTGWSVVVTGHAEVVYEDDEVRLLERFGLRPWADAVPRQFWVRIRPTSITGRQIPPRLSGATGPAAAAVASSRTSTDMQVLDVLHGEGRGARQTPFGDVATVFSGQGIEVVSVSKLGEAVDEHWFSSHDVDVILVLQGQLKFEFESPRLADRVLSTGEVLVLPADTRCRAYRWPRDADQASVFVAAYSAPEPQ